MVNNDKQVLEVEDDGHKEEEEEEEMHAEGEDPLAFALVPPACTRKKDENVDQQQQSLDHDPFLKKTSTSPPVGASVGAVFEDDGQTVAVKKSPEDKSNDKKAAASSFHPPGEQTPNDAYDDPQQQGHTTSTFCTKTGGVKITGIAQQNNKDDAENQRRTEQPSSASLSSSSQPGHNSAAATNTTRSSRRSQVVERMGVGAFAIAPTPSTNNADLEGVPEHLLVDETSHATTDLQQSLEQGNSNQNNEGLAVANPVEDISVHSLPQAEEYSSTGEDMSGEFTSGEFGSIASFGSTARKKGQQGRSIVGGKGPALLLGSLLLLAAVILPPIILLPSLISSSKKDEEKDMESIPSEGTNDSSASTAPPTPYSKEAHLLSLLGYNDGDGSSWLDDTESSQYKAYQWLLEEDHDDTMIEQDQQRRIQQKFALATLYHATGGDDWNDNTNWLNHSVHECDWFQHPSFAQKHITSLYIPGYLAGFLEPLPPHCNDDGLMEHLWLDQNNLVGSIPTEVYTMMTSLQSLSLGWNLLEGTISTHVGKLSALQGLALRDSLYTGTLPSEVGLMTGVKILHLGRNQLEGSLPSEIVTKLTNVVDFAIYENHKLSGNIPSEIGGMSRLTGFWSENTDLSGTIPTQLGQAESLAWLSLSYNRLSGTIPTELAIHPSKLSISLHGNDLSGTAPSELGSLPFLMSFLFHGNRIAGTIPSEYGLLTNLAIGLGMGDNQLTGVIPSELGQLARAQWLSLENNQLSGPIPSTLGQLVSVSHLALANNSLSGTVPLELSALQSTLHTMELKGNPLLSGTIPEELCYLNNTCVPALWTQCDFEQGLTFDCTGLLCGCDCQC